MATEIKRRRGLPEGDVRDYREDGRIQMGAFCASFDRR
ncbi:MAG: hypothetical protein H6Q34_185 [Deltaproteobacteria bacterium]|jgi:hypothetical protein|nr:hypothetical protein [Deltaproteobacteria bacterium]